MKGAFTAATLAVVLTAAGSSAAKPKSLFLRSLQMVDADHGYALGGLDTNRLRLLRTDDGGRRWTDITPAGRHPSGPIGIVGKVRLLVSTQLRKGVFAVEHSDDGGRSWRSSLPFRDAHGLGAGPPSAVDARHLYLATDEGAAAGSEAEALYTSDDGGHSWHFVSRASVNGTPAGSLPFGCDKNGYGFATAARGWAGGYCAGGSAFLYRTDDGGRSWHPVVLRRLEQCSCDTTTPAFFTARVGAFSVIGFGGNGGGKPLVRVYWTTDGGLHWRASAPRAGRASGLPSFADGRTAWLATTVPGRIRPPFDRLLLTADAGRHWHAVKLSFDAGNYLLDAVSATVAYGVRFSGGVFGNVIVRTEDGGRSWQTIHAVMS